MNGVHCWKCGKVMRRLKGSYLGTTRRLNGKEIRLHVGCAEAYDREHPRNPANAVVIPGPPMSREDTLAACEVDTAPDSFHELNFHDARERY